MSGISSNASLGSGKVPQRMIRELSGVPYFVTLEAEGIVDFGNTSDTGGFTFAVPSNRRAKPFQVDIFDNGEAFAGTTTKARVDIGIEPDPDEYATTGDIADGDSAQVFSAADGTLVIGDTEIIEPGTEVTVTCVDATGTPTGQAKVAVTLLYFE